MLGARTESAQGCAYVAVTQPGAQSAAEAEVHIPTDWLMPSLDLEIVRQAQRPDTFATLTSDALNLTGIELKVERRWIREPFWHRIKDAVAQGYIYKKSAVEIILRGDRRERPRLSAAH